MRTVFRAFILLAGVVALPAWASAQASITGIVKDTSGAVLPGVTVEAASDVLIEKVRSAVTDSSGQYQNRRFASRHLYRHIHVDGFRHGEAGSHRTLRHVHGNR